MVAYTSFSQGVLGMHVKSDRQVELEARLEELSQQKQALAQEANVTMTELRELLEEEQYATWGLTKEEYHAAKQEAYPDRQAQRELDAVQARLNFLAARAEDPRKPAELRKKYVTEAHTLRDKGDELQNQVNELSKQRRPLGQVLNEKRRLKNLGTRNAQQATATPAAVGAKAKKRGE